MRIYVKSCYAYGKSIAIQAFTWPLQANGKMIDKLVNDYISFSTINISQ